VVKPMDLSTGSKTLSGALTANTYKDLLTVTGQGVIDICAAHVVPAAARTVGLKLAIDGASVFDAVSASTSTSGGIAAIGTNVYTAANSGRVGKGFPRTYTNGFVASVKCDNAASNEIELFMSYRPS